MPKYFGPVVMVAVLFTGCQVIQLAVYEGQGIWRKENGSTFVAPGPIFVRTVRILQSEIRESSGPTDLDVGQDEEDLPRQRRTVREYSVNMDVETVLENGERYPVSLSVQGSTGSTKMATGSFTASNDHRYQLRVEVLILEQEFSADLEIESMGPVRYYARLSQ